MRPSLAVAIVFLCAAVPIAQGESTHESTEDQTTATEDDAQTTTAAEFPEDSESKGSPTLWIDDPSARLSSDVKTSVLELLETHERMTGQTVRLLIDSPREDIAGPRQIVVSINTEQKTGAIHSHFTFDPVFAPERARDILKDVLVPALRRETLELAVQRTLKALFEILESPLSTAPSSFETLPAAPARGFSQVVGQNLGWLSVLVMLAASIFAFVLQILTRLEVHFSSEGAAPIHPFRQWWEELRQLTGRGRKHVGDNGGLSHGHW